MDLTGILELAQAGAIPMLTIAVVVLWRRQNAITDDFLKYLKDSAQRGDTAAQNVLQRKEGQNA